MKIRSGKNLCFLVMVIIALSACGKTEPIVKPNIVYILTDQWRASALSYAGDPNIKTPNLDQFAKEAVNFTNAITGILTRGWALCSRQN